MSVAEIIVCPRCFGGLPNNADRCPYCGFDHDAYLSARYDNYHMEALLSFSWIDSVRKSKDSINKKESFIIDIHCEKRDFSLTLKYPQYFGLIQVTCQKRYEITVKTVCENETLFQSQFVIERENYIRDLAIGLKTDSTKEIKKLFRTETIHGLSFSGTDM